MYNSTYAQKKSNKKPISIVTIGGGTGSFAILSELRKKKESGEWNITIDAIVSMSDSGGSTGVLMDQYGVLPPGDIRQCLVALSPESEFLRKLFLHRYNDGFLKDHSFGNIFLSTIESITKSFPKAIEEASHILHAQGKVHPVTLTPHKLQATFQDGRKIISEKNLDHADLRNIREISFDRKTDLNKKLHKIIQNADIILINPGSFFTSIVPNFLVPDLLLSLKRSTASVFFTVNMVTEKNQTTSWSVLDFLKNMEKYIRFSDFNYILYNTNQDIVSNDILERYKKEGKFFVHIDKNLTYKKSIFVGRDFLVRPNAESINKNFIRYDGKKLIEEVWNIYNEKANKK